MSEEKDIEIETDAVVAPRRGRPRMARNEVNSEETEPMSAEDNSIEDSNARTMTSALQKILRDANATAIPGMTVGIDKTIPGGRYLENGVLVDAWGNILEETDKDPKLFQGNRYQGTPDPTGEIKGGRKPGPGTPDVPVRNLPR